MVEVPFFSLSLEISTSFLKQVNYAKNMKGLKWIFYTKKPYEKQTRLETQKPADRFLII